MLESLEIRSWSTGQMRCSCEMLTHKKSLSCFSVVQAAEGAYELALDGGPYTVVGAGEVFISPAGAVQNIIHHNDRTSGKMAARWVFIDLFVNGERIGDKMTFPVKVSGGEAKELGSIIQKVVEGDTDGRSAQLLRLCALLLTLGKENDRTDPEKERIKKYILDHFSERISYRDLAAHLNRSQASFYRFFGAHFGCSPSAYIHDLRLSHAALMLETGADSVTAVSEKCGYEDVHYFIKLFTNKFGRSPSKYRAVLRRTVDR